MNGESTNALVGPLDADAAIKSRILTIRGVQVMLDRDLAELLWCFNQGAKSSGKAEHGQIPLKLYV